MTKSVLLNRRPSMPVILVLCVLAVSGTGATRAEQATTAKEWVCPPCGDPHDDNVYSEEGRCPVCGMTLVERQAVQSVAILIFDGVQIIDYTGPYEVFGQAGLEVFTVSPTGDTGR